MFTPGKKATERVMAAANRLALGVVTADGKCGVPMRLPGSRGSSRALKLRSRRNLRTHWPTHPRRTTPNNQAPARDRVAKGKDLEAERATIFANQ